MPWIGIEQDQGLFYEGTYRHGHAVLPTPVTAPALIVTEGNLPVVLAPPHGLSQAKLLFREDSYDAVTRVRRGRVYLASETRPEDWEVYPHPFRATEAHEAKPSGTVRRRLFTFQPLAVMAYLKEIHAKGAQPLLIVGTGTDYTVWTFSSVEGTSTGEYLVTLRGRPTFGALPDLTTEAIPVACRQAVLEAYTKLGDEAFRAGAGSIVDRARDAASAILSGYLQDLGVAGPGLELNELIKKLNMFEGPQKKRIAASAAEIVRLLHSREKPSVRERLPVKAVREQEAHLAVYLHRHSALRVGMG